tara:strand:- start:1 stop:1050 length:1050 start_codon:yes stop_codon:yes gene_type:complete
VKLIIKKSFIITLFIVFFIIHDNSYSTEKSSKDSGIISIMYHRFEENKYPSTNIKTTDFKSHLQIIKDLNYKFISHKEFIEFIDSKSENKKILLTIDDGFSSFYKNAWPILKKEKIPFIIFINTESVGSPGYMDWEELKEISESELVHIGNHSHSHGYLVDKSDDEIRKDIEISIKLLEEKLGNKTKFFAYPFGEYKNSYKKIVKDLGFNYGFGQHSGVMDLTKDKFELPRFPINEKYGEIKRFKRILNTIPFPYKKITPNEKYLNKENNPPKVKITFFPNSPNIKNINCYSNELNEWRKSKIKIGSSNELEIILAGKFTTERGRINCSLRENTGEWRWLGIQFVISDL